MMAKIRSWGALILFLTVLLAACSSAPTQTPASNEGQVPVTGANETPPPIVANTALPTVANTIPATIAAPGSTVENTPTSSAEATSVDATATSAGATSSGSGITYILDPSNSEASYAVREQLARLNTPSDAVGKTNAISGTVTINQDGSIDSANSKFTVDLSSLQSDSNMRDNYVRRNILRTDQYPQAVFVPTQVSELPASIPQSGSFSFKLTGDLTIQDVTKPVTWDVTASMNNGEATGTATTSFTFEDFGLHQPQVPVVLSVVDNITLNVTFTLKP